MPLQLIQLKPDVALGWMDETRETPAVQVDGWFITAENDHLEAVDDRGRRGRVEGGDVVAKSPSPEDAVLMKPSVK
jgi:hypothetical protein